MAERFNLSYSQFDSNISSSFKTIRGLDNFNDVTLACIDGEVSAHKLVLFTSSEPFQSILPRMKHPNPYIFLKGIRLSFLETLLTFMYTGAVEVSQQDLNKVLKTAKDLGVKGLIEATEEHKEETLQKASMIQSQLAEMMQTLESEQSKQNSEETPMEEISSTEEEPNILEPDIELEEDEADIVTGGTKEEQGIETDIVLSDSEMCLMDPSKDLDERAHEMMEKSSTADNRVCWVCKFCGKQGGDKSNIRRHVKGKHLKLLDRQTETNKTGEPLDDSDNYDVSETIEVDLALNDNQDNTLEENEEDISVDHIEEDVNDLDRRALAMMGKEMTEDYRVAWSCKFCGKTSNDKTRTRKHVISHFRDRSEKKMNDKDSEDSSKDRRTANYTVQDNEAVKLMVKTQDDTGDRVWGCTVCGKTHFHKGKIRTHIIANHKEFLSLHKQ